ncbi:MAG: hypothetical protein WBA57_03470 [Elainellaceae cyanobacterium]
MKTTVQPILQNSIECPDCGRHTVVEVNNHLYRCLNCDFYRALSIDPSQGNRPKKEEEKGNNGIVPMILIGLLMLLFI